MKVKVNKTNANNKKVTKTKTIEVELATMQLYDDVSVTIEKDTLADMEHWAYKTEEQLAYDLFETARAYEDGLFDTARAYEDGKTDRIGYTEDELNDMMVRAGLVANLFDKDSDTYALSLAIIKNCVAFLDVLHGKYDCLKLS